MQYCPKCKATLPAGFSGSECPACGIIFAKYFAAQEAKEKARLQCEAEEARRAERSFKRKAAVIWAALTGKNAPKTASCPTCGGLVAIGAKSCPHCGRAKPAPAKTPLLAYVFVGVLALWFITTLEDQPVRNTSPYSAFNAQTECERYVSRSLKSPSSAKFAPHHELVILGQDAGPWTVVGWVDSQNSFGAMLRSRYICEVEFSGNTAKLLNLSLR